jgi:hypothetical protein
MAEKEKSTPNAPPFPFPDLTQDIVRDDTDTRGKALVPFDPLQRYLAEIRRFPLLSR